VKSERKGGKTKGSSQNETGKKGARGSRNENRNDRALSRRTASRSHHTLASGPMLPPAAEAFSRSSSSPLSFPSQRFPFRSRSPPTKAATTSPRGQGFPSHTSLSLCQLDPLPWTRPLGGYRELSHRGMEPPDPAAEPVAAEEPVLPGARAAATAAEAVQQQQQQAGSSGESGSAGRGRQEPVPLRLRLGRARRRAGPGTPTPSWKMEDEGATEGPGAATAVVARRSSASASARQLGASLWEIHDVASREGRRARPRAGRGIAAGREGGGVVRGAELDQVSISDSAFLPSVAWQLEPDGLPPLVRSARTCGEHSNSMKSWTGVLPNRWRLAISSFFSKRIPHISWRSCMIYVCCLLGSSCCTWSCRVVRSMARRFRPQFIDLLAGTSFDHATQFSLGAKQCGPSVGTMLLRFCPTIASQIIPWWNLKLQNREGLSVSYWCTECRQNQGHRQPCLWG
jgi:hypothetical protein